MDLKALRKDYKLSPSDLAELFKCSVGHIYNIESGSRTLTELQIRILIDKYGYDEIAKYADPEDLPKGPTVNIDMHKTSVGDNNNGPVNAGNGNQTVSPGAGLISVMQKQADQNSALIAELAKRSEQMDRLILLLEKQNEK